MDLSLDEKVKTKTHTPNNVASVVVTRVLNSGQLWTLRRRYSLWLGAVLCIVGYLAASLASTN